MSAESSLVTDPLPVVEWLPAERRAWRWPERLKPSEWCEAEVHIPDNAINPEPGPYSFDRTPYLREIIDTIADPVVREIWVYKPTQVGFTRAMINLICYWMDQDPGAVGLLLPDEDTVDELFAEELKPTIDATPALKRHKTARAWDATKREIWLDSGPVFGLYAGSVQKLARRALRYAVLDEIDKYRPFKTEASPIQLIKKRLSNWLHRARLLAGSSPTTRDGNIAQGYEACPEKREYFCRCPICGTYTLWTWANVKGFREAPGATKWERANWVRLNQPCYYECDNCHGRIDESHKSGAVARGVWVSGVTNDNRWQATQRVNPDGTLSGERRPCAKVGFHLTSLLSPWLSFSDLAAEFIEAEGDSDRTRDFRNARLALPWDEVVKAVRPSLVREKKPLAGPPLVVPKWTVALIAAFDTQKGWFAGTIRAWGWGYKSALIWHGECQSFDEVYHIGLESRFQMEDGSHVSPAALVIDSGGDRTDEVYQFALRDARIMPMKGANHPMRKPWTLTTLPNGLQLRLFDPNHYKDMLTRLMSDPDPTKWLPHNDVSEQYCLEMSSEHKIVNPKTKRHEWVPTGSIRQEAWDCETMQAAAADMANVGMQVAEQQEQPEAIEQKSKEPSNWATSHKGRW